MPGVIDRQLDSLDLSAYETAEANVSPAAELEDLLAMAVALYERQRAAVQRWQASLRDWEAQGWVDQARRFEARYRRLKNTFDRISGSLARLEAAGQRADGAASFRAAKLDLDLLCQLSVERMMKADASQHEGRGRPMAEVRDELRHRLGA